MNDDEEQSIKHTLEKGIWFPMIIKARQGLAGSAAHLVITASDTGSLRKAL